VSLLIIPAALLLANQIAPTSALFSDLKVASSTFRASIASPPSVSPGTADLYLRVGDRCENAPLATVTNPTTWSMTLSVSADGWLSQPASVSVTPSVLGPHQTATVSFTKGAVEGPTDIHAVIRVTSQPGSFVSEIVVTGLVDNPAGAASPGYSPPPGCVSTPRSYFMGTLAPNYSFETYSGDLVTPEPWVLDVPALSFPGDGSMQVNRDGRVLRPNGTVEWPDGSVAYADGSVKMPDGSVKMPDGSVKMPDGSVKMPDGSVQMPDGSVQMPEETAPAPTSAEPVNQGG
jgi:hypothetical protein